ncbi:MAG: 50S ribosomal protein L36 [Micrococcales bacterium]|nr:50S ribosomal protein L36 [Micrococcales bacterium]
MIICDNPRHKQRQG